VAEYDHALDTERAHRDSSAALVPWWPPPV
jgi:hypothetical protein